MLTRQKVRRKACWVGVAVGAVCLLALIVSLFGQLTLGTQTGLVQLGRGSFAVYWDFYPSLGLDVSRDWRVLPSVREAPAVATGGAYSPGWFVLPLWLPVVLGLWCAYLLLPERAPRHKCDCGYDLTGIRPRDGKRTCPECGKSSDA